MNCEKCQEQLSEFLDGTLGHSEHAAVGAHLAACGLCAAAREDFHAIIAAARDARGQLFAPTDERALWLRVREEVEAESRPARAARAAAGAGFWSRLFGQRFELSLPQLAAGAAALVVAAASVTALGVRYATTDAPAARAARAGRLSASTSAWTRSQRARSSVGTKICPRASRATAMMAWKSSRAASQASQSARCAPTATCSAWPSVPSRNSLSSSWHFSQFISLNLSQYIELTGQSREDFKTFVPRGRGRRG